MVFLWVGVYFNYTHIFLDVFSGDPYIGFSYQVEINFSEIWEILKRQINKLIQGF